MPSRSPERGCGCGTYCLREFAPRIHGSPSSHARNSRWQCVHVMLSAIANRYRPPFESVAQLVDAVVRPRSQHHRPGDLPRLLYFCLSEAGNVDLIDTGRPHCRCFRILSTQALDLVDFVNPRRRATSGQLAAGHRSPHNRAAGHPFPHGVPRPDSPTSGVLS